MLSDIKRAVAFFIIGNKSYILNYSYDTIGRVKSIHFPNGVTLDYSYDQDNPSLEKTISIFKNESQLGDVSVQTDLRSSTKTYTYTGKYQSNEKIKHYKQYDNNGNPKYFVALDSDEYGEYLLDSASYTVNGENEISEIDIWDERPDASQELTFEYDNHSRLVLEVGQSYRYDVNGNRAGTEGVNYNYTPNTNKLSYTDVYEGAGVGWEVSYDQSGKITALSDLFLGTQLFNYNAQGQLRSWSHSNKIFSDEEYFYNALRQRVIKRYTYTGLEDHFLYDANGTLLAQVNNDTDEMEVYVYLGGEVVGVVKNNWFYAIHNDHLGRPYKAYKLDGINDLAWEVKNTAFGRESESLYDSGFRRLNIGFPGQYLDKSSGFWYNWHRYYSQEFGRYLQPDPIRLDGGANTYAYVENNPNIYIDYLGLFPIQPSSNGCWGGICAMPPVDPSVYARGPYGPVCGPSQNPIVASWIPDGIMEKACAAHDAWYSTCGKSQAQCDRQLLTSTGNAIYYGAVSLGAKSAYDDAQAASGCDCNKP